MATTTYSEPVGAVLHFPNGHTVKLVGGQHVNVPAGTIVEGGVGGAGPRTLPVAGVVVAEGSPGQTEPVVTGQRPPPKGLAPSKGANTKAWDQTEHGQRLENAYTSLRTAVAHTLPGLRNEFQALGRRPIGG